MQKKRLAVITARADDPEQKEVLCGIAEAALSADADVVVYSNIYNHWTTDKVLNYENIIYDLFEPRHFDGVIITAEAFMDISVLDKAVERIRKAKLPAVVIGGELDGFISVYSDDEADMERMTEHLISKHGFTEFDILTGAKDDPTAQRRAAGCLKAFKKHGIAFDSSRLHYGDFWNSSGEALGRRYLSKELPFPQAVICTNDLMAFGLCDVLTQAGIAIPETLSITGYDYTGGRIYHLPLLTTYRRNRRGMGHDAVNSLLGCSYTSDGRDTFISGDSCPCGSVHSQLSDELLSERIGQYHQTMNSVAQFSSRLTACRTLEEYTSVLSEFFYLLHSAEGLHLCLDSGWSNGAASDEYLCCRISADGACDSPERYPSDALPPVFSDRPCMYYFSPVCFQTRLFGYTVLRYSYPTGYDLSFRDWCKTVADTLEFLRMKNDIHYLKQCQRESSLYDALTGFYNLREFRQIIEATDSAGDMYAIKLSFTADSDFHYGESFRNDTISAAATAIKQACSHHEVLCRADDDIFLILCKGNDKAIAEKLNVMLHNALGAYDERQLVISIAATNDHSPDKLCADVDRHSTSHTAALQERRQLQHYNALLDIRKALIAAPHKAVSLSEASRRLCVSEGYFRSVYKKCFEVSYNQDCINAKLMKARFLLLTTAMSIYAVAVSCGYNDEKFFARQFSKGTGFSPTEYRKMYADTL